MVSPVFGGKDYWASFVATLSGTTEITNPLAGYSIVGMERDTRVVISICLRHPLSKWAEVEN
jgi:hypothetical protein